MPPPPSPPPAGGDEARLADLLAAYDDALAGGAAAAGHAPPWRHLDLPARARLDRNRSVLDSLERLWPRSGSVVTPGQAPAPPADPLPSDFGRFRVRGRLGSGGCGVVFLADDPILGRAVALKVPRPEVLGSPDLSRRFLREARTAALLTHPNIVPVYEAGGAGGVCYIAAEFCPGPTLAGWLADRPDADPEPRSAAALVAALADAMGYAHRRGIVHRDLKPSNVLLYGAGSNGQTGLPPAPADTLADVIPKVTDFGFAKLLERTDDATRTGTVIGTPQYMAPEQAEGRLTAVGPATDVYALGAVLFELLTGVPPIRGTTDADTLRRVVFADPPRPRQLRPGVHRDLEAVCLKCLEKDPVGRYPDGAALAADLWRFLGGEPTRARPVGFAERAGKWVRRNPLAAGLAATVAVAAVGMGALGGAYNKHLAAQNEALAAALARETAQAGEAERARARADDRAAAARHQAYLAQTRYLGALARTGRLGELAAAEWDAADGADTLRGFEWHYLERLRRAARVWRGFPGVVEAVAGSADGTRAVTLAAGEARVWDAAGGRETARVAAGPLAAPVAMSADGRRAAVTPARAGGEAVRVLVIDAATGRPVAAVEAPYPGEEVTALELSRAGDRLLVATPGGWGVFDAGTGAPLRRGATPGGGAAAALAPAGDRVAVTRAAGGGVFETAVVDVRTGAEAVVPGAAGEYRRLRFSAGGRHLAGIEWQTGLHARAVLVWDAATLTPAADPLRWEAEKYGLAATGDGRVVAFGWGSGDDAAVVRLWAWTPGGRDWTETTAEPGCATAAAAVTAGGRRLLVGGADRTARVIEIDRPVIVLDRPAHTPAEAWAVAFSPDGRTVVTGGDDHAVAVWDARTGAKLAGLSGHEALVPAAVFLPGGRVFATGSFDGTVRVWDAATRAVRRTLTLGGRVRALAASPDGALLAAGGDSADGVVSLWDPETGAAVCRLPGHGDRVRRAVFAGPRVLITSDGGALRWWDVSGCGRLLRTVPEDPAGGLAVTPDGKTLVAATETGQLVFRDVASGAERRRVGGPPKRLTAAAVSPDGRTVATGGMAGLVRLWRAETGDELFPLIDPGSPVHGVAFSPDGTRLAATRHNGHLLIWSTRDP